MKKAGLNTGLLFGSFNPIHIGHLALANYIVEYSYLDEIWFMVSPHNPFKESNGLADESKRFKMVELAIEAEPRFRACDLEFQLPRPSYTINTLKKLDELYPAHRFTIIMGSDNLLSLNRWKDASAILTGYPILVYPRPGYDAGRLFAHSNIQIIKAPLLDISSTLIREGVAQGKALRFLLPAGIFNYIKQERLYQCKSSS